MEKHTLDNVSVCIKDENGDIKVFFPTVEKFVNYVTDSDAEGWYNKNYKLHLERKPTPWYRKLLP